MATPLKQQFPLPAQTLIRRGKCHDCGGPVQWLTSKSGAVYYNCYNSSAEGDPCQAHHRVGGRGSRDLRRAYLVASGEIQPVKIGKPADAQKSPVDGRNENQAPAPKKEAQTPPAAKNGGEYAEYGI
ncbi:zinc ribbon domain-containing protein [Ruegeria pomeroyi]|uniref:zinc ribbon domain-containing protein n=1 Tax=Ruegeria pomeroyi TaxID=89184 RepID=UPI001F1ADC93|nr:zinc ribbon domain-containing protein [Ruegeria pomeroyi]MCE8508339.1 zinc ribbon domain-containing protein [Ruegeria pomeroyi]